LRAIYRSFASLLLALLLAGCGMVNNADSPTASTAAETESAAPSATPSPVSEEDAPLLEAADEVVRALRDRDLHRLASWIHPDKGLLFSPYPHLDPAAAQTFPADALPSFSDSQKLVWGVQADSGEKIELTFREYFDSFVYDQDYAEAPSVSVNRMVGQSNVAYNGQEVFPGSSYVEYHYSGFDAAKEGMDWKSLILVFEPAGKAWKLVAIAHGQWTA
jgi:hypothetical protein